ncbi:hypothetical protein BDZ94DRAFT_1268453 [Collybia nuda]|uniref:Uncharacterized protein n=1 Tax=Collybia nuda TaxID=64659 RepID=A0A9P6CFW1_9AGAR|nr:hypothetical protein BDZ94DRAFT_1268453 [Collybia nuda]
MRRRAPPTSLRLVQGPTPSRNTPRHTLPSIPRPTFHPPTNALHGPEPRARQTVPTQCHSCLTPLIIPGSAINIDTIYPQPQQMAIPKTIRGPWDHSGSIPVPFVVEDILAPLKPVAVSPGAGVPNYM